MRKKLVRNKGIDKAEEMRQNLLPHADDSTFTETFDERAKRRIMMMFREIAQGSAGGQHFAQRELDDPENFITFHKYRGKDAERVREIFEELQTNGYIE